MLDQAAELRHTLNAETAPISWAELERHFARGVLVSVDESLNLLDVGVAFAKDDQMIVKGWLNAGKVGQVSTEQAKDWAKRNPQLWAVVVSPWILVQEKEIQPIREEGTDSPEDS